MSRLRGRLLHFPLIMILMWAAIILTGCAAPAAVKKEPDITNLKLQDFSELKVPGTGNSALFTVGCYDVPLERFAIVRIAADQMHRAMPADERGTQMAEDGIFAVMARTKQRVILDAMLEESNAKLVRTTSMLFYDGSPDDIWLTRPDDHGEVMYTDTDGTLHRLRMNEGFLGVGFAVSFERGLLGIPLTILPQYQRKDALPKAYLQKLGSYSENGRMILAGLSFTTLMNIGDFLVICPEMVPLDEGTFSSYAFRGEKESTFKIYLIYCKSLTGI